MVLNDFHLQGVLNLHLVSVIFVWYGYRNTPHPIPPSYDGKWIVSQNYCADKVTFWDAKSGVVQFTLHSHNDWVNSIDQSDTAGLFVTGSFDGHVKICMFFSCSVMIMIDNT